MAGMPAVTSDAIALTEKKMDMTLDDIIKMSKKTTAKAKRQRTLNKSQRAFPNSYSERNNASRSNTQLFLTSRSSALRQGRLADMRTRNVGSQFSAVKEAARKAALVPVRPRLKWNKIRAGPLSIQRNGPYQVVSTTKVNGAVMQRPQTLDSLFANMKEQRMRAQAQTGWRPRNYAPQQRNFNGRQRNFIGPQRNFVARQRSN